MNFNQSFYKNNRKALRSLVGEDGLIVISANGRVQSSLDGTLPFRQDSNFWYLAGVDVPSCTLVMSGEEEYLILPPTNQTVSLFEGFIDKDSLKETSGISEVLAYDEGWKRLSPDLLSSKKVGILKPAKNYIETLNVFTNPARQFLMEKISRINRDLKFDDISVKLATLRAIKSPEEIQTIQKAIDYTIELFIMLRKNLGMYKNEKEAFTEAQHFAVKNGLDFGYDPIIASGKNALILHYSDNNAKLANTTLFDIGLRYQHYTADITRTMVNKPTKRFLQVYRAVENIYDFCASELRPGVSVVEYEKKVEGFVCEELIKLGLIKSASKEDIRKYYPHATSHFLGLDVHDVGDYKGRLRPGMVLTVEPGLYIADEGIGIRLEDNFLITKEANQNLSVRLPRRLF